MQIGEATWSAAAAVGSSDSDDDDDDDDTLELVLHDACFRRVGGIAYEVDYGGSVTSGNADGGGIVRLVLREGVERCTVRWARTEAGGWRFDREVHVGSIDAATSDGRDKVLHNLGFVGDELALRLSAFQIVAAIEPSGRDDAVTQAKLARIVRYGRVVLDPIADDRSDGGHRT